MVIRLLPVLFLAGLAASAAAQGQPPKTNAPPEDIGIYCLARLNTSEAADMLIARAEQLTEDLTTGKEKEKNWNDVIAMYATVLDRHPDALHPIGDHVYLMASDYCRRRILAFPKDGLDAYNAMYNSEAERKFDAARRAASPAALREIVQRYFPTSVGDDAYFELANHHLENGQYEAALNALLAMEKHPAPDVNPAAVWARKAICLKRLGRAAELARLLAKPPAEPAEFHAAGKTWKLADFMKAEFETLRAFTPSELSAGSAWPIQGGNAGHNARLPDLSAKLRRVWSYRVPDPFTKSVDVNVPPPFYPVATAENVYLVTSSDMCAVWTLSGKERWRTHARWVTPGRALGTAVTGSTAYGVFANLTRRGADQIKDIGRRMWAFDAHSGEVTWKCQEPDISMSYRITPNSEAPPTVVGSRLYTYQFREERKIWRPWGGNHPTLVCLDPASGRVFWETTFAMVPNREKVNGRNCDGSVPVEAGGAMYVQSNCGAIAAVDASSGDLLWAKRYNEIPAALDDGLKNSRNYVSWWPSLPVVHAGVLYIAPTDADAFYGIEAVTGKTLLNIPRGGMRQFLGVDSEQLYFTEAIKTGTRPGQKGPVDVYETLKVLARDRLSGTLRWEQRLDAPVCGLGAMSTTSLYVPTTKAIYALRLTDGTIDPSRTVAVPETAGAGNLIAVKTAFGTMAITASDTHLNMYYDPEEILAGARRARETDPHGVGQLAEAEVQAASGQTRESMAAYDDLARNAPPGAEYGGTPVGILARDRLFDAAEAAARGEEKSGDAAHAAAAWKRALASAHTDGQVATAQMALGRVGETARQWKEATTAYQQVLSSGGRRVKDCGENRQSEARRFAFSRIRELIEKAGRDAAYGPQEQEAKALWTKGTPDALQEIVERLPNSSFAPESFAKLIEQETDARARIRLAGQLLTLFPESESARRVAPAFVKSGWAEYATPAGRLEEPVLLKWSVPKEEQDRLTRTFFLYRPPDAKGAASPRLLMGVRPRQDPSSCLLQCLDLDKHEAVWETRLFSPKLEPAAINGVSPASDLIVAGTSADVFGLEPADGRIAWKYSPQAVIHGIRAEGKAVAVSLDNEIVSLDSGDGTTLWTYPLPGYVYDAPYTHEGYAAVFTRAPSRMFAFDLLSGSLIAAVDMPEMPDRSYGAGPWVAQKGRVVGIIFGGSVCGYDIRTAQKLWSTTVPLSGQGGWLYESGPWFCVTPGRGYGFQVGGAALIEPETGRVVWKKDFPAAPGRDLPAGGRLLDATDRLALCSWVSDSRNGVATLWDLDKNKMLWSYSFPFYQSSYAAFQGRITESHAVVLTSKGEGFSKTVFVHAIDLKTGKGQMHTLDGGKSDEGDDYGGVGIRPLDDSVLLSLQTGLFCFGTRNAAEAERSLEQLKKVLEREPNNFAAATGMANHLKSMGKWLDGFAALNRALAAANTDNEYGALFRARRVYREQMTRHMAPIKIPKLAQAPAVNGKLDGWPATAAAMDKADCFDHGSQAKGFADYRRPRDCEARIRLGWNDTNLYIAVEVEDDLLFTTQPQGQGRSAQMAPFQDMLRFGFARVDEAGLQIAAAYQVAPPSQARKPLEQSGVGDMSEAGGDKGAHLPLPAETAPVQRKLLRPVGREQAKFIRDIEKELPKIPMAINLTKKEDGNYRIVYEIALPWKLTGLFVSRQPESPPAKDGPGDTGAEKPRQGLEFGLLLNVRDQDESVIVKWLGLGPDDIESDRTHSYVPVVLE